MERTYDQSEEETRIQKYQQNRMFWKVDNSLNRFRSHPNDLWHD